MARFLFFFKVLIELMVLVLGFLISVLMEWFLTRYHVFDGLGDVQDVTSSFMYPIYYLIACLFILAYIAPILSLFFRRAYLFIAVPIAVMSLVWLVVLTVGSDHRSALDGTGLIVMFICLSMPLSYGWAWRLNNQYWKRTSATEGKVQE